LDWLNFTEEIETDDVCPWSLDQIISYEFFPD
jgi:hypothetical protein